LLAWETLLTTFVNTLMSAEADAVCGAPYGTSSPEQTNRRSGYRPREFDTRAGTRAEGTGSRALRVEADDNRRPTSSRWHETPEGQDLREIGWALLDLNQSCV
jgi:hypothetical protein